MKRRTFITLLGASRLRETAACSVVVIYRCLIGKDLVTTARPGPVVSAGGLADAYLRQGGLSRSRSWPSCWQEGCACNDQTHTPSQSHVAETRWETRLGSRIPNSGGYNARAIWAQLTADPDFGRPVDWNLHRRVGNGPAIGDLAGYSTLLAAHGNTKFAGMGRLWTIEAEFAVTGQ